jgi:hypothetical protein
MYPIWMTIFLFDMMLNPQQYLTKHWREGHLKSLLFDKPVEPKPHYVVHKGFKLSPDAYAKIRATDTARDSTDQMHAVHSALLDGPKTAQEIISNEVSQKTVYKYLSILVDTGRARKINRNTYALTGG